MRRLLPSNEGFELRFPDEWGRVLVHQIHNLNGGICPRKKEMLNELIVNYNILRFLSPLKKILIVGKMEFPQRLQIPLISFENKNSCCTQKLDFGSNH